MESKKLNSLADLMEYLDLAIEDSWVLNDVVHGLVSNEYSHGPSISLYYADGFVLHYGMSEARLSDPTQTAYDPERTWNYPGNPTGFTLQACVFDCDATYDSGFFRFGMCTEEQWERYFKQLDSEVAYIRAFEFGFDEQEEARDE